MSYSISVLGLTKTALVKIQRQGIHNLKDLIEVDIHAILKVNHSGPRIAHQILQERQRLIRSKGFKDITFESLIKANIIIIRN